MAARRIIACRSTTPLCTHCTGERRAVAPQPRAATAGHSLPAAAPPRCTFPRSPPHTLRCCPLPSLQRPSRASAPRLHSMHSHPPLSSHSRVARHQFKRRSGEATFLFPHLPFLLGPLCGPLPLPVGVASASPSAAAGAKARIRIRAARVIATAAHGTDTSPSVLSLAARVPQPVISFVVWPSSLPTTLFFSSAPRRRRRLRCRSLSAHPRASPFPFPFRSSVAESLRGGW